MTADEFRELVLGLPGVEERAHMGHPDFRVNGRIFATLQADDVTAMVKVAPGEQAELLRDQPKVFRPAAGAWGRQGCTLVHLPAVTPRRLRPSVQMAYEAMAARPPARKRKASRRRA